MIEPIRIEYGQEREQFADLYLPDSEGPHPVLVVIHGGRWQSSSRSTASRQHAPP
jgi:acetyl esterase/lipase